jgi:hypothetical protein
MQRKLTFVTLAAGLAVTTISMAQTDPTPGVKNIAPGVREINGAEVPSVGIDTGALEATIKETHSFAAAKALLGGEGIDSVGPGGTTTYMYKAHDTVTAHKFVIILFVKDGSIVDYLMQDLTPK